MTKAPWRQCFREEHAADCRIWTGTGCEKADRLKDGMCMDTDIEHLEGLKNFI